MPEIRMSKSKPDGLITIVDDCDADLGAFNWYRGNSDGSKYAHRKANKRVHSLHRVIMERVLNRFLLSNEHVDHINGDTLDNRRCNLRLASKQENNKNRKRQSNNNSGYKGVYFKRFSFDAPVWCASIRNDKKRYHLGYFSNIKDAARAYNEAALKYHGEFARLNVIEGDVTHG